MKTSIKNTGENYYSIGVLNDLPLHIFHEESSAYISDIPQMKTFKRNKK